MRVISLVAASAILLAEAAYAAPISSTSATNASPLVLVQQKQEAKSETLTEKVKRTWRRWTTPTYTFCARCPVVLPMTATACSVQAKDRDAARSACASRYPFCAISDQGCG